MARPLQIELAGVPRPQRRALAKPLDEYLPYSLRGMAETYTTRDYTQKQKADRFGVYCSTVSLAVRVFQ